jgi:hypothetical protein
MLLVGIHVAVGIRQSVNLNEQRGFDAAYELDPKSHVYFFLTRSNESCDARITYCGWKSSMNSFYDRRLFLV